MSTSNETLPPNAETTGTTETDGTTNPKTLPRHAAALLLVAWAQQNNIRGFLAPPSSVDENGTHWSVLRTAAGYELHGLANHFAVVNYDAELRRLEGDYSICVRNVRPIEKRLREIDMELGRGIDTNPEFGTAQAAAAYRQTQEEKEVQRVQALYRQRDEFGRQFAHVNQAKEKLQASIEAHKATKPDDTRYIHRYSRDLRELAIQKVKG